MSAFVIPIIIITVLVLLNGLFVAAEFAIIGVRPTRMAQLAEQGNRVATNIQQTLESPVRLDRYIATAQLGITLVSLGLGMYGEHTIAEWLLGPLEHSCENPDGGHPFAGADRSGARSLQDRGE